MDLSLRLLADASNAQGAFKDFGTAATAAGAILKDFAADSIKAFMEAERAQKQLTRAAGENTEAFTALADQMSRQLAIEDEEIKHLQSLALNYGILPQQVEGATRAVLDYAAATGVDANSAMMQLIRGIEAGNGTLGRMGVTFDATGDKATDLATAIEALNGKFGGAAATDADTMEGRVRGASIAWGEFKESVGGFFAMVESKTGAMDKLSQFIRDVTDQGMLVGPLVSAGRALGVEGMEVFDPSKGPAVKPGAGGGAASLMFGDLELKKTKTPSAVDRINAASRDDARLAAQAERNKAWIKQEEEFELQQHELYEKQLKGQRENIEESNELMMRAFEKQEEEHTKDLHKLGDIQFEMMKSQTDRQKAELERRTNQWMRIGAMMGQALVNGILDVIEGQKSGQDGSKVAIGITRGLFNAVFSMFGMGWLSQATFAAGDVSAEGGGLAGLGAFVGGTGGNLRMDPSFSAPSKHTGGWIERFHGGGPVLGRDERMAILQTGERVLSRREVASMGGMGGVDAAARGGSGGTVVVQAFDSSSLLDFFGDRGGRGMMNAARANVGPLRLMFGKV